MESNFWRVVWPTVEDSNDYRITKISVPNPRFSEIRKPK